MKLELKHLAPYLPYKLKAAIRLREDSSLPVEDECIVTITCFEVAYLDSEYDEFKPIMRPLSDLTKVNGFSLSDMISHGYHNPFWLPENFNVIYLMHLDFEKLVSWHFDVFGLIEKGLAIDINTIKK